MVLKQTRAPCIVLLVKNYENHGSTTEIKKYIVWVQTFCRAAGIELAAQSTRLSRKVARCDKSKGGDAHWHEFKAYERLFFMSQCTLRQSLFWINNNIFQDFTNDMEWTTYKGAAGQLLLVTIFFNLKIIQVTRHNINQDKSSRWWAAARGPEALICKVAIGPVKANRLVI